ncbi:HAMP domain-containing sensor histidine kinase [Bacillus sp. FJAT-47783]|uniref:sensor histidine kinase n=1 Tax=Bacillus sp. FJAT-47783 TaxID=2922712 RepID=UPI001FAE5155|nr:HAMP domain-containing sensor histidine kinase [Bacillus sp. FJAT-47783]
MVIEWLNQFKNRPIKKQLLIIFISFILFIGIAFVLIIPSTLNSFFTSEMFKSIEESQGLISSESEISELSSEPKRQTLRSVQHLFIQWDGTIYQGSELSSKDLRVLYHQALNQEEVSKRYVLNVNGQEMLYVISKREFNGVPIYQVSYLWDAYRKEVVHTLLKQIYYILFIILIVGIVLSFFLSNWFVRPLITINEHVRQLSRRKWDRTVQINRKDEIGTLAASIESMRKQLKAQDETQQNMLQHISHDLKTPVMVIRSYADCLKEGVYPTGTLEGTADIIEQEAVKLEKKIKDLLYLTKLDYLSVKGSVKEEVPLHLVVKQVVHRLKGKRQDVHVSMELEEVTIVGDKEQWITFFENLLDNFFKYAKSNILLTLKETESEMIGTFLNDGDPIDEEIIEDLFKPYVKGKKGHFGLGLAIMKRIASLHQASITAENVPHGVQFTVIWEKGNNSY